MAKDLSYPKWIFVPHQHHTFTTRLMTFLSLCLSLVLVGCSEGVPLFPASRITPTAYTPQVSNGLIAFSAQNEKNNFDIYVMQPDGSQLQRLTKYTEEDTEPVWSPDGAYILYNHAHSSIYRMKADGSDPKLLLDRRTYPFYISLYQVGWSRDGTKFAFGTNQYPCREGEPAFSALVVVDIVTGYTYCALSLTDKPSLTNIMTPSWSPDGQRLAFVISEYNGNDGHIYVINADGTDLHQIKSSAIRIAAPTWLPDGNHLIFTRNANNWNPNWTAFYIMDAEGHDARPALNIPGWEEDHWESGWATSADGRIALVWLLNKDPNSASIMMIDTRTLAPVSTLDLGEAAHQWMRMSPDMQKILYQGQGGYYIMNIDGTGSQLLSAPSLKVQNPNWQPVWR
jgi:TolB protein